jgi:nucleotide-binding universal stress UspA family protein
MELRAIQRILVPSDFSDPSNEALATAMAFANAFGGTLDLVHVAVAVSYPLPPPLDVTTLPFDMTKTLELAAAGLADEENRVRAAGITCESATLVGKPDVEIVNRAKTTGANLIVMGTHGRSGLAHALLGSVAEHVVRHAPCPILIVPQRPAQRTT